jgi:hypothetical protein
MRTLTEIKKIKNDILEFDYIERKKENRLVVRVRVVGICATVAVVHHPPFFEAINQVNQVRILFRLADERRFQQFLGRWSLLISHVNPISNIRQKSLKKTKGKIYIFRIFIETSLDKFLELFRIIARQLWRIVLWDKEKDSHWMQIRIGWLPFGKFDSRDAQ